MRPRHLLVPTALGIIASIASLTPPGDAQPADNEPDAKAVWYHTRGRHLLQDGHRLVYAVRRYEHRPEEDIELRVPMTELWTVSVDTLERELLCTFLDNAEVARTSTAGADGEVIVARRSVGELIGRRFVPMGVVILPWIGSGTFRYDVASGQMERLPDDASLAWGLHGEPSPDGRLHVAVGQPGDDQDGVWLVDTETLERRSLCEGGLKQPVRFSGDGQRILLAHAFGYAGDADLATIDIELGDVSKLGLKGVAPVWSPDDTMIAYTTGARGGRWMEGVPVDGRLFVANADGSDEREVCLPGQSGFRPKWSPDAEWIAYLCSVPLEEDEHTRFQLRVVNMIDGTRDFVVTDQCRDDYIWLPDGSGIVTTGRQGELHRIDERDQVTSIPLGMNAEDSVLAAEQVAAMEAAGDVLQQAAAACWGGRRALDDADLEEGRQVLTGAAEAFAALPERFPAVRFLQADVDQYADRINELALASDDDLKRRAAVLRASKLQNVLVSFQHETGQLPTDLAALLAWALEHPRWGGKTDDFRRQIATWFQDPDATEGEAISLDYALPEPGTPRPVAIVTNPRRPGLRIELRADDRIRVEDDEGVRVRGF